MYLFVLLVQPFLFEAVLENSDGLVLHMESKPISLNMLELKDLSFFHLLDVPLFKQLKESKSIRLNIPGLKEERNHLDVRLWLCLRFPSIVFQQQMHSWENDLSRSFPVFRDIDLFLLTVDRKNIYRKIYLDGRSRDVKRDRPSRDSKRYRPSSDVKRYRPSRDVKRDRPSRDGKRDRPSRDGKRDLPSRDGKLDPPPRYGKRDLVKCRKRKEIRSCI
ncbi:hypothetical protein AVEN_238996-1 [Araneus ventricosus]|uniref:Uncharacterized protein n=1 Tax=Araneus ventricosus TaxID=182803 RepID=A0A4Y2RA04_ARAVE|nr:hypothetical protein AVEN_238996-1 [Araneus ventricosus]